VSVDTAELQEINPAIAAQLEAELGAVLSSYKGKVATQATLGMMRNAMQAVVLRLLPASRLRVFVDMVAGQLVIRIEGEGDEGEIRKASAVDAGTATTESERHLWGSNVVPFRGPKPPPLPPGKTGPRREPRRWTATLWLDFDDRLRNLRSSSSRGGCYVTLRKRRRRCKRCGHRHGPTRTVAGKECGACGPSGITCGCRFMTDWPHPNTGKTVTR